MRILIECALLGLLPFIAGCMHIPCGRSTYPIKASMSKQSTAIVFYKILEA